MSDKERQNIIDLFRNNMKGYLAINDIQEAITSITYLFWNAKYVVNSKLELTEDNNKLDCYLQQGTKDNQDFIWNICNSIRSCIVESNLYNILKYLDNLSEKEIIDIICEDYGMFSRYNISTPKSINELTYQIFEKNNNNSEILDICSYTGNFLTYYAKRKNNYNFTGIEINTKSNIIAQEKMNALKVDNQLIENNVFAYKFTKKYDKVFCNYPFGLKFNQSDLDLINKNHNELKYEFTGRISSCWAFVNSVINSLSKDGKGIAVMNNAGLYKLPDAEYRKLLVDNGLIEAVISLPEKIFAPYTSIPVTLLVLSRNNKQIKFINAEKMILNKTTSRFMNELDVEEILKEYNANSNTSNTKIVNLEDVKNNNYSLYTSNYMEIEKIEIKNPMKLNTICKDIYRGYQVSSNEIKQYSENINGREEYQIVNITNITDGNIDSDLTKIYPDTDKMDKYLLQDKDLLVSSKGTLSKFAVVEIKNNEKYIPSGNFTILRLDTNFINPYYLKIFFESNKGTAIINSIKSGGVLPAINLSQFKEINVPVPSIEEQNRIVNRYLAKTDEIKMIKNKLNKLEENLTDIANEEF